MMSLRVSTEKSLSHQQKDGIRPIRAELQDWRAESTTSEKSTRRSGFGSIPEFGSQAKRVAGVEMREERASSPQRVLPNRWGLAKLDRQPPRHSHDRKPCPAHALIPAPARFDSGA
jgi:hypothetical protein